MLKKKYASHIHYIQSLCPELQLIPYLALDMIFEIIICQQYKRFNEAIRLIEDLHKIIGRHQRSREHDEVYLKLMVGLKIKVRNIIINNK